MLTHIDGDRLRRVRRGTGISQSELARRMGVDRNLISMAENGAQPLAIRHLVSVCTALGVSADVLLGLADNDTIQQRALERARKELVKEIKQTVSAYA